MKILGIECSSRFRSIAAVEFNAAGEILRHGRADWDSPRDTPIVSLVTTALRQADINRREIQCLAIGIGPGSLTGIRIAIAHALGWSLALPIRRLGISTIDVLARQIAALGHSGSARILIDLHCRAYAESQLVVRQAKVESITPPRYVEAEAIDTGSPAAEPTFGPELATALPTATNLRPEAEVLCRLASEMPEGLHHESLAPIQLRETRFTKAPPPRQWSPRSQD